MSGGITIASSLASVDGIARHRAYVKSVLQRSGLPCDDESVSRALAHFLRERTEREAGAR